MDQTGVRITFCIPVHNAADYLRPCIDSVLNQGLSSCEILCVDDGSSDSSVAILKELQASHPEITLLQNPSNKGVSYTRNAAIRAAKGKYLWFVDADDLMIGHVAERFLKYAEDNSAEAVIGKYRYFVGDEIPQVPVGTGALEKADPTDPWRFYQRDQDGKISFGLWLGVFRKSFLVDNGLFFRENMNILEDAVFYFELAHKASAVYLADDYGYLYRVTQTSLTHGDRESVGKRYCDPCITALEIFTEYAGKDSGERAGFIRAHLITRKTMLMQYLLRIPDRGYVKEKLRIIREKGYYPYRYIPEADFLAGEAEPLPRKMLKRMVAVEPLFWLAHALVCYRVRKRNGAAAG